MKKFKIKQNQIIIQNELFSKQADIKPINFLTAQLNEG